MCIILIIITFASMESNNKSKEVLDTFFTNNKLNWLSRSWGRDEIVTIKPGEHNNHEAWNSIGPFAEEELTDYKPVRQEIAKKVSIKYIPKELNNKKFKIGDYEVHVVYHQYDIHLKIPMTIRLKKMLIIALDTRM